VLTNSAGKEIHRGIWSHGVFKDQIIPSDEYKLKKILVELYDLSLKNFESDSPSHKDKQNQIKSFREASKIRSLLKSVEVIEPRERNSVNFGSYSEIDFTHSHHKKI
jgi:hypothetical protein